MTIPSVERFYFDGFMPYVIFACYTPDFFDCSKSFPRYATDSELQIQAWYSEQHVLRSSPPCTHRVQRKRLALMCFKAFVKMFSIYSCSMLYQQITSLMVVICNKLFLQFLEFIDQCPITTAVRLSPPTPQFCRMQDFCTSGIINLQKEFCELTWAKETL